MYHFPNSIDKTATATAIKNYIDDEEAGECNCIALHCIASENNIDDDGARECNCMMNFRAGRSGSSGCTGTDTLQ